MTTQSNDPVAEAGRLFSSGCNCAQSVFAAFAESLGLDEATALQIAAGFGGGMGRLQKTCGAVTGGIMALGVRYGTRSTVDQEARKLCYQKVRELVSAFETRHGSSDCKALLGFELGTPEAAARAHEVCPKYVEAAARAVAEMISHG